MAGNDRASVPTFHRWKELAVRKLWSRESTAAAAKKPLVLRTLTSVHQNAQKVQNSKLFDKSESCKRDLVMPCSNSGRLCESHELSRNCGILHTVFLFWSDGTGFIWLAHNGHIILMLLKFCFGIFGTLEWKMCLHSRSVKGRFYLHIHVASLPRWQTSGILRSSSAKFFSSALKSFWFKCQDVNHT